MKIAEYVQNAMVTVPEIKSGAETLNAFTKWILDLIKNAGAVGVLQYVAEKSQSRSLDILSKIALFALFGYCISYSRFVIRPFFFLKNRRLAAFLDDVADRAVFITVATAIVLLVQRAVTDFAAMQVK